MTDIASNVERIIDKLDGMTTEVVPKTYGTDIASKVEHIAKQLDYVQAGGGEDNTGSAIVIFRKENNDGAHPAIDGDLTYQDLVNMYTNGQLTSAIYVWSEGFDVYHLPNIFYHPDDNYLLFHGIRLTEYNGTISFHYRSIKVNEGGTEYTTATYKVTSQGV